MLLWLRYLLMRLFDIHSVHKDCLDVICSGMLFRLLLKSSDVNR
jgi:hypothetical protein